MIRKQIPLTKTLKPDQKVMRSS